MPVLLYITLKIIFYTQYNIKDTAKYEILEVSFYHPLTPKRDGEKFLSSITSSTANICTTLKAANAC